MPHTWDPDRYLTYADERGRPFVDLLARIGAESTAPSVVDLGCGPGNLTGLLAERWPDADVLGLDSSPEMIARRAGVRASGSRSATSATGSSDERRAGRRAGLQRHAAVGPGPPRPAARAGRAGAPGRLVRLPGARQLRRAQPHASAASWPPRSRTPRTPPASRCPTATTRRPTSTCWPRPAAAVDAWETTYLHVLTGEDPVFTWVSGTGARPTLQALPTTCGRSSRRSSRRGCGRRTPRHEYGVVLPFRRVFVVARVGVAA